MAQVTLQKIFKASYRTVHDQAQVQKVYLRSSATHKLLQRFYEFHIPTYLVRIIKVKFELSIYFFVDDLVNLCEITVWKLFHTFFPIGRDTLAKRHWRTRVLCF